MKQNTILSVTLPFFFFVSAGKAVIICENAKPRSISCHVGDVINITSASYGRTQPYSDVCPGPGSWDNNACVASESHAVVGAECDGKSICHIPNNNQAFGNIDPCPGAHKYVNVTYNCTGKISVK